MHSFMFSKKRLLITPDRTSLLRSVWRQEDSRSTSSSRMMRSSFSQRKPIRSRLRLKDLLNSKRLLINRVPTCRPKSPNSSKRLSKSSPLRRKKSSVYVLMDLATRVKRPAPVDVTQDGRVLTAIPHWLGMKNLELCIPSKRKIIPRMVCTDLRQLVTNSKQCTLRTKNKEGKRPNRCQALLLKPKRSRTTLRGSTIAPAGATQRNQVQSLSRFRTKELLTQRLKTRRATASQSICLAVWLSSSEFATTWARTESRSPSQDQAHQSMAASKAEIVELTVTQTMRAMIQPPGEECWSSPNSLLPSKRDPRRGKVVESRASLRHPAHNGRPRSPPQCLSTRGQRSPILQALHNMMTRRHSNFRKS